MKPRVHQCAAKGCARLVPQYLLMCMDHWRMVPAGLQRGVFDTLKAMRGSQSAESVKAYRAAVAVAVSAVAKKQVNKINAQAGGAGDLFSAVPDLPHNPSGVQPLTNEHHGDTSNEGREPNLYRGA